MLRIGCIVIIFALTAILPVSGQDACPPDAAELNAISRRGQLLAKMQLLKDNATKLLLTKRLNYPNSATTSSAELSVLVQLPPYGETKVVYGRLGQNRQTYFIDFAVTGAPGRMAIKTYNPPLEVQGYFLRSARALTTARTASGDKSLSYLVLPLDDKQSRFYVYFYPRATEQNYLLGGDIRYKVVLDGESSELVETKKLHNAILTYQVKKNARTGYHSAVLDEKPEDTDVLHVLTRQPCLPELVSTGHYVYRIDTDGHIKFIDSISHLKQKPR